MRNRLSPLNVLAVWSRKWQSSRQPNFSVVVPLALYIILLWRSTWKTNQQMGGDYWRQMRRRGNAWSVVVAAHVVLWRYLFTKAVLATKVGALFFQKTVSVPLYAVNFVGEKTSNISLAFQDGIQQRFDLWLDSKMNLLGEKIKELLKDPYMPEPLLNTIEDAVDFLLPDLKLALFIKTDEYITFRAPATQRFSANSINKKEVLLKPEKRHQPNEDMNVLDLDKILDALADEDYQHVESWNEELRNSSGKQIFNRIRRFKFHFWGVKEFLAFGVDVRGWILYTLSPYDKTIWRCLHNPWYYILTLLGLLPSIGVLWWIFLFAIHDKRDEYQLCQFIVGFQTAKFFSQGWFSLIRGAFLYYMCATRDISTCDVDGPRVSEHFDAFTFVFQIILVWLTFFILPYTQPCSQVENAKDSYLLDFEMHKEINRAALQAKVRLGRGGRLMNLFWWETFTVLLVSISGCVAFLVGQRDWKLLATFYWLRTIYGLLSLPFVPFKLPIMGGLLTPTKATGYTREGKTVIRVIEPALPDQKSEMDRGFSFTHINSLPSFPSEISMTKSEPSDFEYETKSDDGHYRNFESKIEADVSKADKNFYIGSFEEKMSESKLSEEIEIPFTSKNVREKFRKNKST